MNDPSLILTRQSQILLDQFSKVVTIDTLCEELFDSKKVTVSVLRLDKTDNELQGNKFFKLMYFLEDALSSAHKKIITFGGPYSNHLSATAAACNLYNISSVGLVAGIEPKNLSSTLLNCRKNGMEIKFMSRERYKQKDSDEFKEALVHEFGPHTLVPEGGYGPQGVSGAELIYNYFDTSSFSHICCPVGSGITIAGIINAVPLTSEVMGFYSFKNIAPTEEKIANMITLDSKVKYRLNGDFHFGGFAKRTDELTQFMNRFYISHQVPTDFIYTGKMMFGIYEMIKSNCFPPGSHILAIHTGGLQGNASLPINTLCF